MERRKKGQLPIAHWSYSSLMAFLRNPLAWYARYVEEVYDTPVRPSTVVGRAGHKALEHFYGGAPKDVAVRLGLEYIRNVADFEIDFGAATSRRAKKARRAEMEKEYLRAISYYLEHAPKHEVLGVEVRGVVGVKGFPLPLKAVSDLVVASRVEPGAVDIVDHKFVASFSKGKAAKPHFLLQALFNYYTVRELFGKPVRRFIVYECKRTKNSDGSPQLRRSVVDFRALTDEFALFRRLITDATREVSRRRIYLPNPSDVFEGEHSLAIYRLGLVDADSVTQRALRRSAA